MIAWYKYNFDENPDWIPGIPGIPGIHLTESQWQLGEKKNEIIIRK